MGSLTRVREQLDGGTDWDQNEIYWLKERYRLCRRQATHYILCLNISDVLRQVTFPGERLTYLQVVERVVKDCGKWELEQAIREIGLSPHERVYFKVAQGIPVERAEQILLTMVGDSEYILAGNFPKELGISANSGLYKSLKKELTRRGWVWKSKKIKGSVVQIIKGNRS